MGTFSHLCHVCLEIHRGRCFFSGCPHSQQIAPEQGPTAPPSQTPTFESVQAPQPDPPPAAKPAGVTVVSPHAVIHQMATHATVGANEPSEAPPEAPDAEEEAQTHTEPQEIEGEVPQEGPVSMKVCQNCGSLSLDPEYCEHCGAEHQR